MTDPNSNIRFNSK